jgi:hypothetical protein
MYHEPSSFLHTSDKWYNDEGKIVVLNARPDIQLYVRNELSSLGDDRVRIFL